MLLWARNSRYESSVRGCIVIMEQPIACTPQFRSFSPNVLQQTAKNTAVELGVHGLAFGGKFMVHNPSNVEKHEHTLGRAAALPRLLRSWGSWALPSRRLSFSLRIIPIDPTLVPSDNPRHEGWVIQGTLMKLLTNCNTVLFLLGGGQKPGHKLCSYALHVQITCENCLHCSVWHINDCSNVLNGFPTILMHKPPNCFHIFRCWAHGRSIWLLVIFEWCSTSLEARVPLKTSCTTHGLISIPTSYYSKVSAPDLPSFTQNLMFALCSSFTSMLKSQMWRHTWWQTLVLCNSQCSHSNTTWHTEWRRYLLPSTVQAFTYCHRLAFYGTSLETFWYTNVCRLCMW